MKTNHVLVVPAIAPKDASQLYATIRRSVLKRQSRRFERRLHNASLRETLRQQVQGGALMFTAALTTRRYAAAAA